VIYFITGTPGSGKSLCAVGRIRDYLAQGRPVATNMDIFPEKLLPRQHRGTVYRLPDFPTAADIQALPKVCDARQVKKFGALVLDECGMFLSSREWNAPGRKEFVDWLRMVRRWGYDVFIIVQDEESVDKQVRQALLEMRVVCRNWDRLMIPFVGRILKALTGIELHMPRFHSGTVQYAAMADLLIERWWYSGKEVQEGYDTAQIYSKDNSAPYSILSAWHVKGRHLPRVDWATLRRSWWARWLPALLGQCPWVPMLPVPSAFPQARPRRSPARQIYFPSWALDG